MILMSTAELDDLYERSKFDSKIIVGSEVRQLIGEIRHHRRQQRVDTAIAKQLGASIEHNSALRAKIERWQKAYPLDIFPEPDLLKAADVLKAAGMTLDAVSASNIRHALKALIAMMNEP